MSEGRPPVTFESGFHAALTLQRWIAAAAPVHQRPTLRDEEPTSRRLPLVASLAAAVPALLARAALAALCQSTDIKAVKGAR